LAVLRVFGTQVCGSDPALPHLQQHSLLFW